MICLLQTFAVTRFRGVNHTNSCNIPQHLHKILQQFTLNISTILNVSSSVFKQRERNQICFCYLLVNINFADILKSIFSLAVNFETFSGNALVFLCFIPWSFLNHEKRRTFFTVSYTFKHTFFFFYFSFIHYRI